MIFYRFLAHRYSSLIQNCWTLTDAIIAIIIQPGKITSFAFR